MGEIIRIEDINILGESYDLLDDGTYRYEEVISAEEYEKRGKPEGAIPIGINCFWFRKIISKEQFEKQMEESYQKFLKSLE